VLKYILSRGESKAAVFGCSAALEKKQRAKLDDEGSSGPHVVPEAALVYIGVREY
jgi:hypothetical protein